MNIILYNINLHKNILFKYEKILLNISNNKLFVYIYEKNDNIDNLNFVIPGSGLDLDNYSKFRMELFAVISGSYFKFKWSRIHKFIPIQDSGNYSMHL